MKRLALVALLGLCSCGVLRDAGTAVCDAQEKTAEVLVKAGESVGFLGLGPLFADVVNLTLELGCTVFDATVSAPANVSDQLGITLAPEVSDAPPDTPPGV